MKNTHINGKLSKHERKTKKIDSPCFLMFGLFALMSRMCFSCNFYQLNVY